MSRLYKNRHSKRHTRTLIAYGAVGSGWSAVENASNEIFSVRVDATHADADDSNVSESYTLELSRDEVEKIIRHWSLHLKLSGLVK